MIKGITPEEKNDSHENKKPNIISKIVDYLAEDVTEKTILFVISVIGFDMLILYVYFWIWLTVKICSYDPIFACDPMFNNIKNIVCK